MGFMPKAIEDNASVTDLQAKDPCGVVRFGFTEPYGSMLFESFDQETRKSHD
jgi:hypothetical protein